MVVKRDVPERLIVNFLLYFFPSDPLYREVLAGRLLGGPKVEGSRMAWLWTTPVTG